MTKNGMKAKYFIFATDSYGVKNQIFAVRDSAGYKDIYDQCKDDGMAEIGYVFAADSKEAAAIAQDEFFGADHSNDESYTDPRYDDFMTFRDFG